ncbi:MAG TPA: ACT domain-containing protein [Mycobacteriales bacterium]|jgi:glycine cleavage system transcriptional repressor|nr:ACT domain-containing protein [Mycobacteriales bacterium]
MTAFAVTVIGDDRPGIVAAVTSALADLGANLEDSSMTILRGRFAMTLIAQAAVTEAAIRAALVPAERRLGVHTTVAEVGPETAEAVPAGSHYLLSLHGADRPGIVAAITGLVADCHGNITDMTTRLAGDLYVLVCEVDLPGDVDAEQLDRDLAELAAGLGVHASLRAAEAELL